MPLVPARAEWRARSRIVFIGLFVLLQPIAIYGPLVAAASEASGMRGARLLLEGWQGIVWSGALAGILAVAIMLASRLLKRHARQAVSRRIRTNVWQEADD